MPLPATAVEGGHLHSHTYLPRGSSYCKGSKSFQHQASFPYTCRTLTEHGIMEYTGRVDKQPNAVPLFLSKSASESRAVRSPSYLKF